MAAYAELADLKARAGALAAAWTSDSKPGDAELELFLSSVSAQVDAILQQAGAAIPTEDPVTEAALAPIVADGALCLALAATWPGNAGQQAVSDLKAEVDARWQAAWMSLVDGSNPIVKGLLEGTAPNARASSLWDDSPQSMLVGSSDWGLEIQKGITIGPGILPEFHKGQPL